MPRSPFEPTPDRGSGRSYRWQDDAACSGTLHPGFYPAKGEHGKRVAEAKAMCAACPVMAQCRQDGLIRHDAYGIWGGLGRNERERILGVRLSGNYTQDTERQRTRRADHIARLSA